MLTINDYGNAWRGMIRFNAFFTPTRVQNQYQPYDVKDVSTRAAIPFFLRRPLALPSSEVRNPDTWRWFTPSGGT